MKFKKKRCENCIYFREGHNGKIYCTEWGKRCLGIDYLLDPVKPTKIICFRKKTKINLYRIIKIMSKGE